MEDSKEITKPTIHLNGTSRQELADKYEAATRAVQAALEAVGETYPNGRDYYVQTPTAISSAMSEHEDRIAKLRRIRDELIELYEHVEEGR